MAGLTSLKYPELVFGIAGPIGIDIDSITRALADVLQTVGYRSSLIKITDEISEIESEVMRPTSDSFYNLMRFKMAHASSICRSNNDAGYLMRLAITAIRRERKLLINDTQFPGNPDDDQEDVSGGVPEGTPNPFLELLPDGEMIAFRAAYIIRQIKRPQEIELLRSVYGKQFILISAYGSEKDRTDILREK
jgi:hypothetical protein